MPIPNLLDDRILNQTGVAPPIQEVQTPRGLDIAPSVMPQAPAPRHSFTDVLVQAIPLLLAGIAHKTGGSVASGALLQGYSQALAQRRAIEERQREFDVTQQNTMTDRADRLDQTRQAQQAKIADFVRGIAQDLGNIDDPNEHAHLVQLADDTATRAFGTPKGFVSNQLAGTFDTTKATAKVQKEAAARVEALRRQYGDQFDDLVASNAMVSDTTEKQIPLKALLSAAGTLVTTESGEPVRSTPTAPETEAAFIARAVRAEQRKVGAPLDPDRVNQIAADARQKWAQAGHVNAAPNTGSFEDFVTKTYGANPTPAQIKVARKEYSAADNQTTGPTAIVEIKPGTPDYKVAQDLATGRMTMTFFRTLEAYNRDSGKKAALYAKATEINPEFNQADFERGFKFIATPKIGQQLASLDNALSGVPDLLKASDAAARAGATVINKYANPVKVAMGSRNFSNLNTARLAWADEVSGALGFGTASDMKLALGLDLTDTNLSPANFKSAIETIVVPFLERKKASLLRQASVYGTPENNSSLAGNAPKEGDTLPITEPGYPPGAMKQYKNGNWIRIK